MSNIDEKQISVMPNEYKYTDEGKAHLHSYLGKPLLGTSTVVGVLAKNLTWWASGLACEKFGWINKGNATKGWTKKEDRLKKAEESLISIKGLEVEEYLELLDDAYSAHSKKLDSTAKVGTDMHVVMEGYVVECIDNNNGYPFAHSVNENENLSKFIDWSLLNVKKFIWSEKNVYSNRLWTGGIFDVMFIDKNDKVCIGDFKSSRQCFDSQFIQVAGYDLQQSENGIFNADGYKLGEPQKVEAYYVFPFGADKFEVGVRYNVEELRAGFESCCVLYKIINK